MGPLRELCADTKIKTSEQSSYRMKTMLYLLSLHAMPRNSLITWIPRSNDSYEGTLGITEIRVGRVITHLKGSGASRVFPPSIYQFSAPDDRIARNSGK